MKDPHICGFQKIYEKWSFTKTKTCYYIRLARWFLDNWKPVCEMMTCHRQRGLLELEKASVNIQIISQKTFSWCKFIIRRSNSFWNIGFCVTLSRPDLLLLLYPLTNLGNSLFCVQITSTLILKGRITNKCTEQQIHYNLPISDWLASTQAWKESIWLYFRNFTLQALFWLYCNFR